MQQKEIKSQVTKFGTKRLIIGNYRVSLSPRTNSDEISIIVTYKHDTGFTVLHDEIVQIDIQDNRFVLGFLVDEE